MAPTPSVPDATTLIVPLGFEAPPLKRGRKRQHDSHVERRMILDAAMVVMRRNSFAEARITDILKEAGLSNRAFYRHFSSKDELLLGMCSRDMAWVERRLRLRIADAPDPVAALHAYIDCFLSTFLSPSDPERGSVMASDSARRAEGYEEECRRLDRLVGEPLVELIRKGATLGVFRTENPDMDGYMISTLLQGIIAMPRESRPTPEEAAAQVMRFCSPALGLAPTPAP